MSKDALQSGRVNQKIKTRTAILGAAKRLLKKKKRITLEDVAQEASISRATIYRYFSNIELLIMESSLDIAHPGSEDIAEEVAGRSLEEVLIFVQQYYNGLAQKHETAFRRYLSAALNESVTNNENIRGARRITTLNKALEPFRNDLSDTDFQNLVNASAILMGIDALTVSKDVCKLDNEATSELLAFQVF